MLDFLKYRPKYESDDFDLSFGEENRKAKNDAEPDYNVTANIEENIKMIEDVMHLTLNGDIITRRFNITVNSESVKAFIIFADGIVDRSSINEFVLMPVMLKEFKYSGNNIEKFFVENIMPQCQATSEKSINKIGKAVNFGNAGIFVDGAESGIIIDIKTWEHRNITNPINETVVQGPHEGFNEVLRCNTALIRKSVNNSDLVFKTLTFGKKTNTPASLGYIDGIINPSLLNYIENALSKFDDDYIFSVFDIEKGIEERTNITLPQIITTERPDKVCRALVEGRAVLFLNGSSHALILPSNITDIISSPEDVYLRKPYAVFIKFIRILSVFLSFLTPALYLAITRFHTESLLINMLLSIASERGGVPFSSLSEVIIMELSFELIKEASVRIPGSIGSSLGIVGGLILGQAAVEAGLVSPMIIILVAICGIASFAIPSYSLSFSFRVSRFVYIFAGGFFGITGIGLVLLLQLTLILGTKSFGVPFFVPFAPQTSKHPFYKTMFKNNSSIPNPTYLKSGRKGGGNEF